MKIDIKTDIDYERILKERGMGSSNSAQRLLAENVERLSNPYVPMTPGGGAHMKELYSIAPDGSTITYAGPYAHYQYVGEVMVGGKTGSAYAKSGEQKRYTGTAIQYSGGGTRGKEWDKRMMADRGDEVVKAVAKHVGGRAK